MNQHPLTGGTLPSRLDGADLFSQALERIHPDPIEIDSVAASDASLVHDEPPRLSLVRPEDHDDDPAQTSSDDFEPSNEVPPLLADVSGMSSATFDQLPLSESFELDDLPSIDHLLAHDHSEAECITISNPLGENGACTDSTAFADEADPDADSAASEASAADSEVQAADSILGKSALSTSLTMPAPQKIGSGRLSIAKLTWKPGDPFGCSDVPVRGRFRWEIMLTTACVTALCGLACIWVLRTILA